MSYHSNSGCLKQAQNPHKSQLYQPSPEELKSVAAYELTLESLAKCIEDHADMLAPFPLLINKETLLHGIAEEFRIEAQLAYLMPYRTPESQAGRIEELHNDLARLHANDR